MVIKSCPLLVKDTETCVGSSLASYFVLFSLISLVSFYFVFVPKTISPNFVECFLKINKGTQHLGTYKVRNEIETKRNETKRNQRKRNETKRNEINENEAKRNEINDYMPTPETL
jgi:hypothetical protein